MELRQLQYFVAVVEEANFTRAAARLRLAQPGVSAQIRQLERELRHRLLDRSGRSVTLTEVGAAVLPYARAALAAAEGARRTADEFTGLLRGQVTLGLVSGAAVHEFDVVSVLADFHDAHPQVEISVTEDASDRMLAALRAGELDIALLGLSSEEPPADVSLDLVIDEPLVAVVAPGDRLLEPEGRTSVPLAELADRPLISLPRGTGVRSVLDRAFAEAGIRPRIAFEAAAPAVLTRLAVRGMGVAVLPAPSEEALAALGLRMLALTDPCSRGRIALTWRTDGPASPAARVLLDRLRAELKPVAATGRTRSARRTSPGPPRSNTAT
ncbi:LysR family transcriptional regulator [Streptomyces sp. NPDC041068]|uniref:LysR family transcriptional regulator n=1 Tax=Streptomyces sp. NPDC041068 TaxID=3155130 RepID=UPI0033C6ACC5